MRKEENLNEKFFKAIKEKSNEEFIQFTEPKGAIKEKLDQRFAQQYGESKVRYIANFPIALWKVAATWILLIAGAGTFTLATNDSVKTPSVLVKTDTVFVEKKIIAATDTVKPVIRDVVVTNTSNPPKSIIKKEIIYTLIKGRSLAEDTLARSFFVSMM